mmetsp:Transcript_47908/g.113854  ORF Transcript_47908/g.113854 Transcript_47908/m.113854 type:complete len:232 (-) Transcript_47908:9-704(-)
MGILGKHYAPLLWGQDAEHQINREDFTLIPEVVAPCKPVGDADHAKSLAEAIHKCKEEEDHCDYFLWSKSTKKLKLCKGDRWMKSHSTHEFFDIDRPAKDFLGIARKAIEAERKDANWQILGGWQAVCENDEIITEVDNFHSLQEAEQLCKKTPGCTLWTLSGGNWGLEKHENHYQHHLWLCKGKPLLVHQSNFISGLRWKDLPPLPIWPGPPPLPNGPIDLQHEQPWVTR